MSNVIYISGSISDGGTLGPEDRADRIGMFNYAEQMLTEAGFEVLNPARHGSDPEKTWQDYMRLSLLDIAKADGVALLPGWEKSDGARVEVTLAHGIHLPVARYDQWISILRPDMDVSLPVDPEVEEGVVLEPEPGTPAEQPETGPVTSSEPAEAGEPQ